MRLPLDLRDMVKSGARIEKEREKTIRIAIFVEADAPEALVESVQRHFRPFTAGAVLHVEVAQPGSRLVADSASDVVVAVMGSGKALKTSVADSRVRAIPTAVVALAEDSRLLADRIDHPYRDTLADLDPERVVEIELGDWLTDRIPDKRLAFAANFAFMRRAVAIERVKNTAFQNAVVGTIAVFPGADMPVMTANQAKMVLQIAAAYGEQIGAQRARELLAVIGGAFFFRMVARQGLAFLPGFGWAIKGGIGYTATIAMGYAAIKYFEEGADLSGVEERLKHIAESIKDRLSRKDSDELADAGASAEVLEATATLAPEPELPAGDVGLAEETTPGDV